MPTSEVPASRIRPLNDRPQGDGFVLYWSTMARRRGHNPALQRAAEASRGHGLVVLEALRADYPYACDRFTRFVADGMGAHVDHAYFEATQGAGKGLLEAYAEHAGLIVTDDHPGFFIPRMLQAAARLPVRIEAVDGNGLLPLSASPGPFSTAYSFRRHVQKQAAEGLWFPAADPLEGVDRAEVPQAVQERWGDTSPPRLGGPAPVELPGGEAEARQRLATFVERMPDYAQRNHPDAEAESGLSPYLHFGHLGAHEVVQAVLEAEDWHPGRMRSKPDGRRGWWGLSEEAEEFLDQVVTWRELGFTELWHRPDATGFDALPAWAQASLEAHRADPRQEVSLDALEAADSPDPLWNAAQRQLLDEGVMHNYMRMLWGKLILQWSPSPEEALRRLFHLNDTYALDGRDPNSVSGILWCLGKYDRAWAEREVFGKVRYMTSDSARRKLRLQAYLERHGPPAQAASKPR